MKKHPPAMNKKHFGLTAREIIISIIGATASSLILDGVALFSNGIKWNEVIFLRFFAILICQFIVCAVIITITRSLIRQRVLLSLEQQHSEEIAKLQADVQKQIIELKASQEKKFVQYTEQHHKFVHHARDFAVRIGGPVKKKEFIIAEEYHPLLEDILNRMHRTFKPLFPDVKLFTAIRERRGEEYYTIAWGGDTDKVARKDGTEPLHLKHKMVEELVDSFHEGTDCVIITGQDDPNWHKKRKNNAKREDLSVLMGAIFSKEWQNEKFIPIQMEWILCIASDKSGTFKEEHKPLMKCFTDVCGLLVNLLVRQE